MHFNDESGCVKIAVESCCSQHCQQKARRKVASDGNSFSAPSISLLHVHFHLDSFGFTERTSGVWGLFFVACWVFVVSWGFFCFWFGFFGGLSSALDSSAQHQLML